MTVRLIGTADNGVTSCGLNVVSYCKFTALETGTITEFKVYAKVNGNVKVSVYTDDAGEPGARITGNNDSQAVTATQWNVLAIGDTDVVLLTPYHLGIIADTTGSFARLTGTGPWKWKAATYSTFTWPATAGAGFTTVAVILALAGWGTVTAVAVPIFMHHYRTLREA